MRARARRGLCAGTVAALAGLLLPAVAGQPPARKWPTYRGAWFEVRYPPGFRVRPSLRSPSGPGFDSAFFTAPDGAVQLYVFSPQWNGEPTDIQVDTKAEAIVSTKTTNARGKRVRWVTIRARSGRYTRSFADTEDTTMNTRLVFGIRYRDRKAYARWRSAYGRFKDSLVRYAD